MKEIRSIIQRYDEAIEGGTSMALATVVHVEDSSYRRSGARMLITEDGLWTGGISGGCLEGDTLKKAQQAIREEKCIRVRYDTREDDRDQIGVGLGCNGLIDVLISPIATTEDNQIEILRDCLDVRKPNILITVVADHNRNENNGRLLKYTSPDDLKHIAATTAEKQQIQAVVEEVKKYNRSQTAIIESPNGTTKLFIEHLPPDMHLLIFGSNYDVHPLTAIAKTIGWRVTIIGNPLKIPKELFALSDAVVSGKNALPDIDTYTAALLMSHDYATDLRHLRRLSPTAIRYIGLLGPRVRGEKLISDLENNNITYQADTIHAPIGLDTGATTPEEIAISMIAEIRAHFSGRTGGMLRNRVQKIND